MWFIQIQLFVFAVSRLRPVFQGPSLLLWVFLYPKTHETFIISISTILDFGTPSSQIFTPPRSNIDTKNGALENAISFQFNGYFKWYLLFRFQRST